MVGRSHQLVGFATVYSAAILIPYPAVNIQTFIACILCISLGSLTPDLDSQENVLYALVPVGHGFFAKVGEKLFGKHRSISHSMLGLWLFSMASHYLIFLIPSENGFNLSALWYSFMLSLVSHIVADAITRDGVPLLWPIKFRFGFPPFSFLRFKTGSWVEMYVVRSLLFLYLVGLTVLFWDRVLKMIV